MGGFTPPVPQKDSDIEIRVAVMASLFLQVLLIFCGPLRKRSSQPFLRFVVWSCYLLADWVADLALGLLLNNMGNIGGNGGGVGSSISHASGLKKGPGGSSATAGNSGGSNSSPIIFAFWTPFLLLHLGGPDTITAYALEDNELWLRHLIGLLFELFSASVIFFCSLNGNHMIPATVLIFVVGIIKYGERTYSLYSGSVSGFRDNILGDPEPGPNYAKLMTEFDSKEKAGLAVEIVIADGEAKKVQDALEQDEAARLVKTSNKTLETQAYDFFFIFRVLFVNLILSYKERKISQAYFLEGESMTARKAFEVIEVELNFIYDMVYTKGPVAHTKAGLLLRFVGSGCLVSALVLFVLRLHKDRKSISRVDVHITYALLLGGLALDATALVMLLVSNRMIVLLDRSPRFKRLARAISWLRMRTPMATWRWSQTTSQLNLISYCLGKPDKKEGFSCTPVLECFGKVLEYCSDMVREWFAKVAKALHLISRSKEAPQRQEHVFDDFIFIRRERLSKGDDEPFLLKFVFERIRDAATEVKGAKYQEMKTRSSHRGEGALEAHKEKIVEELLNASLTSQGAAGDLEEMKESIMDKDQGKDQGKNQVKEKMKTRNSLRGEGALETLKEEKIKETIERLDTLMGSVRKEFDESLLLWHIATDLCILPKAETAQTEPTTNMKSISKTLSEYMLYLLVRQPEMLSATAGIGLLRYRDTCAEARRFFQSAAVWDPGHADAQRMLLSVNTSKAPREVKGDRSKSVLFDACILAKVLRELDEDTMWEVVGGVWVEMLTYAAGKCRGSTHVRQLSRGGELITLVWFLMAHMGLGDMYQIQEGDAKAKLIVHDQ